ncbi:MAG: C-type lectin domain-containing protein [Sandaracinaceae bacterium]|nr:C-type lectin domain-containing protein [Sandaracinaceae bacterium]
MRELPIVLGCLALAGCASDSIVQVTVESDMAIPTELDEVTIEVEGRSASAALVDDGSLPAMLELRATGDQLGPFDLRVNGRRGGAEVVSVVRSFSFEAGATTSMTVRLEGGCPAGCPPGQRCDGATCVLDGADAGVDAGSEPEDGGGFDAASPDDACAPELCNATDDDCDGDIDESGCEPCVRSTFAGHIYQVCAMPRTAAMTADACASRGYTPVSIADAAEDAFVHAQTSGVGEPWLGLHREGVDFVWVDGTPSGYDNWQTGPSSGQDCAVMRGNGRWRSEDCAAEHAYVCELAP